MQTLVLVPLIVIVFVGLLWAWWSTRGGGSPVSSVNHFDRALRAMSPQGSRSDEPAETADPADDGGERAGDQRVRSGAGPRD